MTTTTAPETVLGRLIKRGDTFDPECGRTTNRLRVARGILADLNIEPTYEPHHAKCWQGFGFVDCHADCKHSNVPTWPDWVTAEMFDLAGRLADRVQTARGQANRAAVVAVAG